MDLTLGTAQGWTTVVLRGRLHPWAAHNLTLWLVDIPDARVLLTVDATSYQAGYWLAEDPVDSWLSGYDDGGTALSVNVPDNSMVLGDPSDLVLPDPGATGIEGRRDHQVRSLDQALHGLGVPSELHTTAGEDPWPLRLEDPGHDLNPANAATFRTREAMQRSAINVL